MNTKDIGTLSEQKVITRLLELGYKVSVPVGDNYRYDLIADKEDKLIRVQVKSGRLKNGFVDFKPRSTNCRTGKTKDYRNSIEMFGVYCQELDSVFLLDVHTVGTSSARIRVSPPKNGQRKGVRLAQEL